MSEPPPPTRIRIRSRPDGPLVVEGSFEGLELLDGNGEPICIPDSDKGNIAICRCGHSQQKPFCDGQHKKRGWTDKNDPAV